MPGQKEACHDPSSKPSNFLQCTHHNFTKKSRKLCWDQPKLSCEIKRSEIIHEVSWQIYCSVTSETKRQEEHLWHGLALGLSLTTTFIYVSVQSHKIKLWSSEYTESERSVRETRKQQLPKLSRPFIDPTREQAPHTFCCASFLAHFAAGRPFRWQVPLKKSLLMTFQDWL